MANVDQKKKRNKKERRKTHFLRLGMGRGKKKLPVHGHVIVRKFSNSKKQVSNECNYKTWSWLVATHLLSISPEREERNLFFFFTYKLRVVKDPLGLLNKRKARPEKKDRSKTWTGSDKNKKQQLIRMTQKMERVFTPPAAAGKFGKVSMLEHAKKRVCDASPS